VVRSVAVRCKLRCATKCHFIAPSLAGSEYPDTMRAASQLFDVTNGCATRQHILPTYWRGSGIVNRSIRLVSSLAETAAPDWREHAAQLFESALWL
jgi:hypothetical protein